MPRMALWTPPHPGVQSSLLTVARSHAWIPIAGELGRLEGHVLTVESAGTDRVRWAVEDGDKLPEDFVHHLVTQHAYTALREGELGQDGFLSWKGQRWTLRQAWDGERMIARLEPLQ
jgi:hypothetical protein